jgi:hypothetical protein
MKRRRRGEDRGGKRVGEGKGDEKVGIGEMRI